MKPFVSALLLLISGVSAYASPIETWQCWDYGDESQKVLVTATVEVGRREGDIAVAGVKHKTVFRVAGFDRRWDFGFENKTYQYAFVIEPNGTGRYFNFGGEAKAKPSRLMNCREIGDTKLPNSKEQTEIEKPVAEQLDASQTKMIDEYKQRIHNKITRLVVLPPNMKGNPEVEFSIVLLVDGNLMGVKLKESSGNAAYDKAVERAILRAEPFPLPLDKAMSK
jgi:TonB family protein